KTSRWFNSSGKNIPFTAIFYILANKKVRLVESSFTVQYRITKKHQPPGSIHVIRPLMVSMAKKADLKLIEM
ncbi:MAG: hypothetical protein COZ08_06480, partial [Bacteroidetes bacterium CG_4_10_14_3_um_filter_42_6]